MPPFQRTDYIVIGAGSAGCVLANRLTASGRHSVLLLEAGPRGRGLGGSSSINGLIYVRGQPEDYDGCTAIGNRGWGWKNLLPYFRKREMAYSDIGEKHELMEAIIRAANELGFPTHEDFNGERQEGVGYFQLFTKNGWRSSSATAYLRPAERRANLQMLTGAHATKILFDRLRARGVRYRKDGTEFDVFAAREIALSAGALQSPQLLKLSGVGPGDLLQSFRIPVVKDLPG